MYHRIEQTRLERLKKKILKNSGRYVQVRFSYTPDIQFTELEFVWYTIYYIGVRVLFDVNYAQIR